MDSKIYPVSYSELSVILFAGSDHLRTVFKTQMGLSDKDIVALSGGHTLVGVKTPNSTSLFLLEYIFLRSNGANIGTFIDD